ncbi:MAG TPA: hypothetical protein VG838_03525 [Opitutaceae bacterium]|nr:hypothetical protein [Opitutaceae bacterium]
MSTSHDISQTVAELMNEIRTLAAEAEKALGHSVTEHSEEALDALRARLEAAQERLASLYEGAKEKVAAGAKRADRTVRDHPYEALAITLGVGVLVGVLLGRRTKE